MCFSEYGNKVGVRRFIVLPGGSVKPQIYFSQSPGIGLDGRAAPACSQFNGQTQPERRAHSPHGGGGGGGGVHSYEHSYEFIFFLVSADVATVP